LFDCALPMGENSQVALQRKNAANLAVIDMLVAAK